MAETRYKMSKGKTIIQNGTSNKYPSGNNRMILEYDDGTQENIESLPGTSIEFEGVIAITMDSEDYANLTVTGYNRLKGFFLK